MAKCAHDDGRVSCSTVFWTEGGSRIGMGHLARSLNIAEAVIKRGIKARFLVNDDAAVRERMELSGFDWSVCGFGSPASLNSDDAVVVIDAKREIAEAVRALKERGMKVVVIDNLGAVGTADGTIIPSVVATGLPRAMDGGVLSGGEYVIIGESFKRARQSRPRPPYSRPLKVLVTMGGADPFCLTEKVVSAIAGMEGIEVRVVLGPAKESTAELKSLMDKRPRRMEFIRGVNDISTFMAEAHIAFTAVGTTVYELAYMGVPSILIANYGEDAVALASLAETGAVVSLGVNTAVNDVMIRGAVESFMDGGARYSAMSKRASALVDGNGADRAAGVIEALVSAHV